jgi:hypothetical protein
MCHNEHKECLERHEYATEQEERVQMKGEEDEQNHKKLASRLFTLITQLGQLLIGRGVVCVGLLPELSCSELQLGSIYVCLIEEKGTRTFRS